MPVCCPWSGGQGVSSSSQSNDTRAEGRSGGTRLQAAWLGSLRRTVACAGERQPTVTRPRGLRSPSVPGQCGLPFYNGEFITEITVFEPPRVLELAWTGPGMVGCDRYELTPVAAGTDLVHKKWLSSPGVLRIMEPFLRRPLFPRLQARLEEIKRDLEEEPALQPTLTSSRAA